MNSIQKVLVPCLIAFGTAGLAQNAYASDADGQRDTSIYDQDPSCLERGELKPGQVPKCVVLGGNGPNARVVPQKQPGSATGQAGATTGATQNGGTFNSSVNGQAQNGGTFNSSVNGQAQNGGTFTGSANASQGGSTVQGSSSMTRGR